MIKFNQFLIAISCLVFTSCKTLPQASLKCKPPVVTSANQLPDEQSNIDELHILIDSTRSMEGFVASDNVSRYQYTLDNILGATTNVVMKQPNVKYYAFGTDKQEINGGDYVPALSSTFYRRGGILKDTQLNEKILSPINKNQLSIVITDLYLTNNNSRVNSNINSVTERLAQEYLQKGYSVGILGIRSEFHGKIFDIGRNLATREWKSDDNNPETFRPFYLIFLGTYDNIASYFEEMLNQSGDTDFIQENKFIIFTSNLFDEVAAFDFSQKKSELPIGLKPVANLGNDKGTVTISDLSSTASFVFKNDIQASDDDTTIAYKVSYFPRTFTVPIEFSSRESFSPLFEVNVFEENGRENDGNSSTTFQNKLKPESSEFQLIKNSMGFDKWSVTNSQSDKELSFSLSLDTSNFPKGMYQANISLFPSNFKSLEDLGWNDWSFSEIDFNKNPQDPSNFKDGNKTLNLMLFLNTLHSITTANVLPAANLCFAIQKD